MHRTTLSTCRRIGLAAVFLLAGACGQNEGGRCQVDSDCASGLTCKGGGSGNGTCQGSEGTTPSGDDAAADVAEDEVADVLESAPEVGPDTSSADVRTASTVDAEAIDTGAID